MGHIGVSSRLLWLNPIQIFTPYPHGQAPPCPSEQNRVTEGSGWNCPLWNGTSFQDPHMSSAVLYHVFICHSFDGDRKAFKLNIYTPLAVCIDIRIVVPSTTQHVPAKLKYSFGCYYQRRECNIEIQQNEGLSCTNQHNNVNLASSLVSYRMVPRALSSLLDLS